MSYLMLAGMVLAEIALLGIGLLVFRRLAARRKGQKQAGHGEDTHADRLLAFLEFEINRMRKACEDFMEGLPARQALERRLAVFTAEREILLKTRHGDELDNIGYAELVEHYYRSADLSHTPEFDKLQSAVSNYQQRIDNLEKFRTLFFRSQQDLADAANRAVDLKRRLDEEKLNEEEKNELIEMLRLEKERLAKELNIADHELEAIMANLSQLRDIEELGALPDKAQLDEILEQMRAIEEENAFLQQQIQHLLKEEMEREQGDKAELDKARAQLAEKDARYKELEQKFLEMESHYLELVG